MLLIFHSSFHVDHSMANFYLFPIPLLSSIISINQISSLGIDSNNIQLSDVCIKCLAKINIFIKEENTGSLTDCNHDGIIACDDVLNQRLFGCQPVVKFRDHRRTNDFESCAKEHDTASLEISRDFIDGDIQSMIAVLNTIFVVTFTSVYKYDRITLAKQQSTKHSSESEAFLFISPFVKESQDIRQSMIRVCKKSTSPLKCIRFNGPAYDNIQLNYTTNETFEQEKKV